MGFYTFLLFGAQAKRTKLNKTKTEATEKSVDRKDVSGKRGVKWVRRCMMTITALKTRLGQLVR